MCDSETPPPVFPCQLPLNSVWKRCSQKQRSANEPPVKPTASLLFSGGLLAQNMRATAEAFPLILSFSLYTEPRAGDAAISFEVFSASSARMRFEALVIPSLF